MYGVRSCQSEYVFKCCHQKSVQDVCVGAASKESRKRKTYGTSVTKGDHRPSPVQWPSAVESDYQLYSLRWPSAVPSLVTNHSHCSSDYIFSALATNQRSSYQMSSGDVTKKPQQQPSCVRSPNNISDALSSSYHLTEHRMSAGDARVKKTGAKAEQPDDVRFSSSKIDGGSPYHFPSNQMQRMSGGDAREQPATDIWEDMKHVVTHTKSGESLHFSQIYSYACDRVI